MSEEEIRYNQEKVTQALMNNDKEVELQTKYIHQLQQENKELKEQVECLINQRDTILTNATEQIENNINYKYILNELESWLEEQIKEQENTNRLDCVFTDDEVKSIIICTMQSHLNKLKELKGSDE